jgi:hypothetical protein
MNIEAYSFTVVSTVLGMLVVFASLTALSLLMVVLKASFSGRGPRSSSRSGGGAGAAKAAPEADGAFRAGDREAEVQGSAGRRDEGVQRELPAWVIAAVAAYLAGSESEAPSAESWLPEFNHYDPWLAPGRSTRSRGVPTPRE